MLILIKPNVFLRNSFQSFLYSLLGPFPWQFRYLRQVIALAETIPWYVMLLVAFYCLTRLIEKHGYAYLLTCYKSSLPLLLFGIIALGALSVFINNYGIIVRIRIPMFICFLSVMFISLRDDDIKRIYEKISHYWRRWVYWVSSIRKAF